jgi:hypothetical protein
MDDRFCDEERAVMNGILSRRWRLTVIALGLGFTAPLAVSATGQHDAHVHGVAEITLAVEGREVEIVLMAPAMSVVGFEHEATSEVQVEAVSSARELLNNGAALFSFKGARCELQQADVDVSAVLKSAETGHNRQDDHDAHGSEEESHGDDESRGADDGEQSHSDISAHYTFVCAQGETLQAVSVGAEALPFGLESINAAWVSDRAQGAVQLTATKRLIQLN